MTSKPEIHRPLTVLAWDTATPWCTAALVRFDQSGLTINEALNDSGLHSQLLPPLVARLLAEAGLTPAQLDLVAVGRGPGSFTGLRTGLALAKGLALGAGVPLMGLSTLTTMGAVMLENLAEGSLAAPLIDARHGEIYTALYRRLPGGEGLAPMLEELMEPGPLAPALLPEKLLEITAGQEVTVAGPALALIKNNGGLPQGLIAGPENLAPKASMLARLAAAKLMATPENIADNPPLPMYIRAPDIRKSGLVV